MMDDREQLIRDRAYAIWQREGRPAGREREHWQAAAREIEEEHGSAAGFAAQAGAPVAGEDAAAGKATRKKTGAAGPKKPSAAKEKPTAAAPGKTAAVKAKSSAGKEKSSGKATKKSVDK